MFLLQLQFLVCWKTSFNEFADINVLEMNLLNLLLQCTVKTIDYCGITQTL